MVRSIATVLMLVVVVGIVGCGGVTIGSSPENVAAAREFCAEQGVPEHIVNDLFETYERDRDRGTTSTLTLDLLRDECVAEPTTTWAGCGACTEQIIDAVFLP